MEKISNLKYWLLLIGQAVLALAQVISDVVK